MNSSTAPSEDRVAYILARINAGLATQWSQIAEQDASHQHSLDDALALGQPHLPPAKRSAWDEAWRGLRATLTTIRTLGEEAQNRFDAGDDSYPLEPWSDLLGHERDFDEHLANIRAIGAESVPASERSAWDDLCASLEPRGATLQAHALTVRAQLELREKYGAQKTAALTKLIAERLPKGADIVDTGKYAAEYRQAAQAFEKRARDVQRVLGHHQIFLADPDKISGSARLRPAPPPWGLMFDCGVHASRNGTSTRLALPPNKLTNS